MENLSAADLLYSVCRRRTGPSNPSSPTQHLLRAVCSSSQLSVSLSLSLSLSAIDTSDVQQTLDADMAVSGSRISWEAICKSAPCSRQTTTPAPHRSMLYRPDALPAAQPTAAEQRQSTESIKPKLLKELKATTLKPTEFVTKFDHSLRRHWSITARSLQSWRDPVVSH